MQKIPCEGIFCKRKTQSWRRPTFAAKPLSSALNDLTSVFDMGTGGTRSVLSPRLRFPCLFSQSIIHRKQSHTGYGTFYYYIALLLFAL